MISPALLAAAALAGLVGSPHCAAMCGGIIVSLRAAPRPTPIKIPITSSVTSASAAPRRRGGAGLDQFGRLAGYGLVGALAGATGSLTELAHAFLPVQTILLGLFNVALVILGLQVAGLLGRPRALEELAGRLWGSLKPRLGQIWPPQGARQHLLWGMAWGLMPCALVYSVVPLALLSGNARDGALLMLAFGAGTLPLVEVLGRSARLAESWLSRLFWRRVAGTLLAGFGLAGAARAMSIAEHAPRWLAEALAWCR